MTAQNTQTQPNLFLFLKWNGAKKFRKNCWNLSILAFLGILDVFSLISRPPYTFFNFCFFYGVCVILNTINVTFSTFFVPKINHLRGEKNCVFVHFSQQRWTFDIILFINMSYFCVLYPFPSVKDFFFFNFNPPYLTPCPPVGTMIQFWPFFFFMDSLIKLTLKTLDFSFA